MDEAQRIAFINTQVVSAQIELEGMKAANHACLLANRPPQYTYSDFMALDGKYMIGHNTVISYLMGDR